MNGKIGRNHLCPCGSGRKYKQCCLHAAAKPQRGTAEIRYNEGTELHAAGRWPEAADSFRAALAVKPDFVEARVNLGNVLQDLGDHEQALAHYRRALELRPGFAELHMNIGLSLHRLDRLDEAIRSHRLALAGLGPSAQLHNNLAVALRDAGRLDEAADSFHAALRIDPQNVDIRHCLGGVLHSQSRLGEAVAEYRAALAVDPHDAAVQQSLARALLAQGRVSDAIIGFRRSLALDPAQVDAHSALLMSLLYPETEPPAAARDELQRFADRFAAPLEPLTAPHANAPDPERPLRIGYVSADFRAHSVAFFIEPVLARHDRSRCRIYCYYNAPREDATTVRLRSMVEHWLPCSGISDQALAERIRADRIDVLVDLSGHTGGNRLLVFARKPAPLQLSWIGYPSTTGLRQIDYRLTDHRASPPESRSRADTGVDAEALYRLPGIFSCYRPPPEAPDVSEAPALALGHVTLGSFNNVAKISDRVVRLWCRLLLAQPCLQLVLKDRAYADESVRAWMIDRLATHGVGPERVKLLAHAPSQLEHLQSYSRVDIALDTYPYCGVTTTCEALWMGVPVVSLVGHTFAARMGLTLLSSVGHPEWLAGDEEDYERKVLGLAADVHRLGRIRMDLRGEVDRSPLRNEAVFTRQLEGAYRAMWRDWCAARSGQRAA